MDEMNPAYENYLNNMSRLGGSPRETTRRVSASKFLGRDDLENRVKLNEKKITILKNIIKTQQVTTGLMLTSLSAESPVKGVEQSIMDIKETMMSILATLQAQEKFEYKKFLDMQRRLENEKRKKRESGLELDKKGLKLINSGVNRVLKPVRSIFSRVLSGIFNLIAGRLLIKLLNFFANPRNAAIVNFLSKFIETFFPVLVAGVGAAAIGLGILTSGFTLATNLIRAASIGLGIVPAGTGVTSGLKDAGKLRGADINIFKSSRNLINKITLIGRKGFNKGGFVFGSGNTDSVPAMLTPGEVVISKPAVQRIGASNLLNLNREFGGTGRPSYRGGMPYAKEGMVVPDIPKVEKVGTPTIEDTMNAVIFNAGDVTNQDLGKSVGSVRGFNKLAMSTQNQNDFFENLRNVFIDFVSGLKPKKEKKNDENLKPVPKTSTSSSEGLGELNDILSKLSTPTETLETENDVIDVSLNPVDLNKLETLGMVT